MESMTKREILAQYSWKHDGDWAKIAQALRTHEPLSGGMRAETTLRFMMNFTRRSCGHFVIRPGCCFTGETRNF